MPRTASEINGDKPLWSSNWSRSKLAHVVLVIVVETSHNDGIRYSPVCEVANMIMIWYAPLGYLYTEHKVSTHCPLGEKLGRNWEAE